MRRTLVYSMVRTLLVLAATLLAPALPTFAEDAADLLLTHGVFYPVEPATSVVGSLAVRDGRIAYLGPDDGAAAFRGPGTEVIDLGGRAVTPGLIDAHSHLLGLGAALAQVDLVDTTSYEEVVSRVAAAAAETPAGTWVRGRGWDQNDWPGERDFPEHGPLSRAVPDHPVWLTRIDGHAALLNAAALRVLGIDAATSDPSGGRFLRDAEGRPTGVLIDNAMDVVRGRLPDPPPAEVRRQLALAARRAAELGLTTVTDMGVGDAAIAAYRELAEAGELPVRAALFLGDDAALLERWFDHGPLLDLDGRLMVRGVKLYADGALGSRGAALVEPYSDDPANLGLLTASGEHLREVATRAVASGFQVGIHAIGDRGNLVALDALEAALAASPDADDPRLRIEHAQVMRPQDIARMARLGVIASMQPTHATSDMPWAPDRLGEHRLAGAYAWREVLDAGGRLALGSDFPVERPDPLLGLHAAVTRQDLQGDPPGGWLPDQRLGRQEALRGFTLDAAWSLFLDHLVGSLEVGKRADLVVFDRDPMTVPEAEIPRVQVDLTVIDGRVVHRREAAP
ncbi:MAG TPA: amidohydrolase [Thermoanaerobaculia bacterium]|nr:amidohydrolase [Thermoanaerobaculia bacterium]